MQDLQEPLIPPPARRISPTRALLVFVPSQFLQWFVYFGPLAYVQEALKDRHGSDADYYWTYALALRGLLATLMGPVLGHLSDRYGRRPIYLFSIVMSGLMTVPLASGVSWGVDVAVGLVALAGVAGSVFTIPFTYCSDLATNKAHLNSLTALLLASSFTPAFVIAPVISSRFLFKFLDKQKAWTVLGSTVVVNALCTSIFLPETNTRSSATPPTVSAYGLLQKSNPLRSFRLVLSQPGAATPILRRLAAVIFFLYFAKNTIISIIVLFAEQDFGWSPAQASMLLTVWGLSQFACFVVLSVLKYFPHVDERKVAWVGLVAGLLGMLVFSFAVRAWILYVGMGVGAVSMVALTAITSYAARIIDESMQGEVQGVMTASISLTEIVGPICFGTMLKACSTSPEWYMRTLPFMVGTGSVLVAMLLFATIPHVQQAMLQCQRTRPLEDSKSLVPEMHQRSDTDHDHP